MQYHGYLLKIEELIKNENNEDYKGLKITTSKGDIFLLISTEEACCEEVGSKFLDTPDNIDDFIGSIISSIQVLNIETRDSEYYPLRETQIKITTDKGVLQYAVYNRHNGHYTHSVITEIFGDRQEFYL